MKKTILSIAVIAAAIFAASCQKENLQENTASEGSASVFTATIETGANTKTTVERIGGNPAIYKTYWESTDQISIDGSIYTATPDDTDKTKATFNKTSGANPTAPFHAYFPASMYSDSKAILRASYTYTDGKYNMPMYAESSTMDLSFRNLCGVLAITVKGTDFTSVSSIEVSSDKQMNGEFTATADGVLTFASKETLTAADKKVTLTFAPAKAIASDELATFYIPVPENTHRPLTIKISGETNSETNSETMVTNKSGGVEVERNTVYPITFAPIKTVADVLATVEGGFPSSQTQNDPAGNAWTNGGEVFAYTYYNGSTGVLIFKDTAGQRSVMLQNSVKNDGNCFTVTFGLGTVTFNMTNGILTSFEYKTTGNSIKANLDGIFYDAQSLPVELTMTPAKTPQSEDPSHDYKITINIKSKGTSISSGTYSFWKVTIENSKAKEVKLGETESLSPSDINSVNNGSGLSFDKAGLENNTGYKIYFDVKYSSDLSKKIVVGSYIDGNKL